MHNTYILFGILNILNTENNSYYIKFPRDSNSADI